jgi:hypothetical protein
VVVQQATTVLHNMVLILVMAEAMAELLVSLHLRAAGPVDTLVLVATEVVQVLVLVVAEVVFIAALPEAEAVAELVYEALKFHQTGLAQPLFTFTAPIVVILVILVLVMVAVAVLAAE